MRGHRLQRRFAPTVGILAAVVLCTGGTAQADVGITIIHRCAHEESISGYTQADYSKALKEMSATTEEYSECGQQIRRAMEAAARAGRGSGGPGAGAGPVQAVAATPAEQRSIAAATSSRPEQVQLGEGQAIHPGVIHANVSSALSTLPAPLLALLAFLALGLLAVGGGALHKRVRDERDD
jgi:hypothetical protein